MGSIFRRKKKLPDGTKVPTGPWYIKYYSNCRCYRETTESMKESEAKRILKSKEGDVAKGLPVTPRIGRMTVDELLGTVRILFRNQRNPGHVGNQ